jgi:coenzyme F420 hydrogenase subunit delta
MDSKWNCSTRTEELTFIREGILRKGLFLTLRAPNREFNILPGGNGHTMISLDAMEKEVVVLGCGNILFGDDGFGSSVAEHLQSDCRIPENVSVVNAGTSVRGILFDLILREERPRKIIVVDAVDMERTPGEIFRITLEELPDNKVDDFTLHEMPTINLLRELRDLCHVEVIIVAGQVGSIPETVRPGLSETLSKRVGSAAEEVLKLCSS